MILKKGFTLVELIVVVTILAILGTIGFVSYSSYLSWVRDANRVSSLQSISDGLQLYSTRWALPNPDDSINVLSSWEVLWYQWNAGTTVLEIIEYSKAGLDPADNIPFTYYLSANKRHHQLMAFLEETDYLQAYDSLFPQAYAAVDYSSRYPLFYGKKLGILTQPSTLIPAQDAWVDIDLATTTNQYNIHLQDDQFLTGDFNQLLQFTSLPERWGRGYSIDNSGRLIYINLELGVSRNGLVWEYHLDGNMNDSSWLWHHGNPAAWTSFISSQVGQGFNIWASQNSSVANTSDIGISTNNYTISFWFRTPQIQWQLFNNYTWATDGYGIEMNNGAGTIYTRHCGPGTCHSPAYSFVSSFVPNKYYHYTTTFDGTNVTIYLDGTLVSDTVSSSTIAPASKALMSFWGHNFEWVLDQVRIYNRALSSSEIQLLYNE